MFINKIGYSHLEKGLNNQDYGFIHNNIKCVVDGCSEGLHSEVGVKLFCHMYENLGCPIISTKDFFNVIFNSNIINNKPNSIKDFLLFTILFVEELEEHFVVYSCGDGIIIKQKHDDILEYEIIEQNNKPKYYAYNYISEEYLSDYKNGVNFDLRYYKKDKYKSIGIASDGLQYILNSDFKEEFEKSLIKRKEFAIKRLINREHKLFKDDITIAF